MKAAMFAVVCSCVLLWTRILCTPEAAPVRSERPEACERLIRWSELKWCVKSCDTPCGPGPNYFSDSKENVRVDEDGQLHLRIVQSEGNWLCAEVADRVDINSRICYVHDRLGAREPIGLLTGSRGLTCGCSLGGSFLRVIGRERPWQRC